VHLHSGRGAMMQVIWMPDMAKTNGVGWAELRLMEARTMDRDGGGGVVEDVGNGNGNGDGNREQGSVITTAPMNTPEGQGGSQASTWGDSLLSTPARRAVDTPMADKAVPSGASSLSPAFAAPPGSGSGSGSGSWLYSPTQTMNYFSRYGASLSKGIGRADNSRSGPGVDQTQHNGGRSTRVSGTSTPDHDGGPGDGSDEADDPGLGGL